MACHLSFADRQLFDKAEMIWLEEYVSPSLPSSAHCLFLKRCQSISAADVKFITAYTT